ncbi:hypothetical protein F4677DRAFT_439003 [Hypoxylon crocopeplum]|nr:hypothetical protein F4677DRAFT_439003 [Hypoxylon crocopeplum]
MASPRILFGATAAFCTGPAAKDFHLIENAAIGIDGNGVIVFVASDCQSAEDAAQRSGLKGAELVRLRRTHVLLPGFIDTHSHAPQWENRGIGIDLPLLQWIDKYTRPTEMTFSSTSKADRVYDMVVRDTLRNGTTTASYFGTIHVESTMILADKCFQYGQRSFVGQPSMDITGYPEYTNDSVEDIEERTKMLIEHIRSLDPQFSLVSPIVTPGFAPVISFRGMQALARLADATGLPMQTHLSENHEEIEEMGRQYPESPSYTHTLDSAGILTSKTILGHCAHLSDEEIALIAERGAGVSHCPTSNLNLMSGQCKVRKLLDAGIKVGLGCDCSGGHTASVLENLRRASDVSRTLIATDGPEAHLKIHELLYMATLGGAQVCGIDRKVGSFEVGKEFDAVLFDATAHAQASAGNIRLKEDESAMDILHKILFCADDRHIIRVFVKGIVRVDKTTEP